MKCPNCGSSRIALDPLRGVLVCQECGTVIEENIIDDSEISYRFPKKELYINKKIIRISHSTQDLLSTKNWGLVNHRRQLEEIPNKIRYIFNKIPRNMIPKTRTRLAIAYYIYERSEGNTKTMSLRIASKSTGVSIKSIEKTVRRYRLWIEDEIRRVARIWERKETQR